MASKTATVTSEFLGDKQQEDVWHRWLTIKFAIGQFEVNTASRYSVTFRNFIKLGAETDRRVKCTK